jgi:invasion protein IalB
VRLPFHLAGRFGGLAVLLLACAGCSAAAGEVTARAGDVFGDWVYQCSPIAEGREACALNQTLVDQQSGSPVLKFSLARDAATGSVTLVALLPLGLDFAAGVSGAVDDKPGFPYGLRTCVGTTCVAVAEIDTARFADLKAGAALKIGFRMLGEAEPRVFDGSLRGMTAAAAAAGF